ncbi:exportin-1 [Tritrichomonas foetus]|uniref:Exportin-1 n=1 Tax=Tritrichomonas foetus TaxID=1144522 RepID=A0A1J4JAU6_9EUKA|nr:exportin-1 [Tritrichomonas foetus]|eukprot:OHS96306.1 exportin-1 [Tritrichomonas foetus]
MENPDLAAINNACTIMSNPAPGADIQKANEILMSFKLRDDAWTFADKIIDSGTTVQAKIFGVQLLLDLVKTKWSIIEPNSREAIKNFLVSHVISWSADQSIPPTLLNYIDMTLVTIIIHEWPQAWPSIVDDLIASATSQPHTCRNNLKILSMLSEDTIEFGEATMTSIRWSQVTAALEERSQIIFNLIEQVLSGTQDMYVLEQALDTLKYIVKWLDPRLIFETQLPVVLCNHFLPQDHLKSKVLAIFGEISNIKNIPDQYTQFFPGILDLIVSALSQTNLMELYEIAPDIVKSTIFTLSSIISTYGKAIESSNHFESLGTALAWITDLMTVVDIDNFKTCCELCQSIAKRYYLEKNVLTNDFYKGFFAKIRRIMIARMERPIEILIVENDQGGISKEETKNTAQIELYNTMREALIFLSNINSEDIIAAIQERIILLKEHWDCHILNTICWSAGAITGSLSISDEKSFVIMILKELLEMNANAQSVPDKASIASGIMFVCSSYPRFLMNHAQFLKTILGKLFEFMHNDVPGVKEMAVDSFKKIAEKCRRTLLVPSNKEPAFIEYLIVNMDGIASALSNDLRAELFNAVSIIIAGCNNDGEKTALTNSLMEKINERWLYQINNLNENDFNGFITILFILRCNDFVAENVGPAYHVQFQKILDQIIQIYGYCCGICTQIISSGGEVMVQNDNFRICSQIKSSVLSIFIKFVSKTHDSAAVLNIILPQIVMKLLDEYPRAPPQCRVPELLTLVGTIISKQSNEAMSHFVTPIMFQLFKPSVELIASDFDAFMTFRIPLVFFMSNVIKICFASFMELSPEVIEIFVHSIEWGCQHPQFDICRGNFELLEKLYSTVESKSTPAFKNAFYKSFFVSTINTVFDVMTDTVHKFAFMEQTRLLKRLLALQIEQNNPVDISQLLYQKFQNREIHYFENVLSLLLQRIHSFPEFKEILRNFLIEVRQYSREDPDLFVEERNQEMQRNQMIMQEVPGMSGPANEEFQNPF